MIQVLRKSIKYRARLLASSDCLLAYLGQLAFVQARLDIQAPFALCPALPPP